MPARAASSTARGREIPGGATLVDHVITGRRRWGITFASRVVKNKVAGQNPLKAPISPCLGRPSANFERSHEIGDREKPGELPVVDHEPTVRVRRRKLRQGVHGLLVLGEQRDLVERDHRLPHAPRLHSERGTAATEAKGSSPTGLPPSMTG